MIKRGFALFLALICMMFCFISASAEESTAEEEEAPPSTSDVLVLKNINTGTNVEVDCAPGGEYRATGVAAIIVN